MQRPRLQNADETMTQSAAAQIYLTSKTHQDAAHGRAEQDIKRPTRSPLLHSEPCPPQPSKRLGSLAEEGGDGQHRRDARKCLPTTNQARSHGRVFAGA